MTPVSAGIPWLGFVVYPDHRLVKARKGAQQHPPSGDRLDDYQAGRISFGEFDASVHGWINHVRFADTWGLREHVLVAAEAVVRNLPAFSRFLTVAALCNGQMLNYSKIASDAQVPKTTVQEYFHILRDTLIGDDLPAWRRTEKRKPLTTAKFYFFDVGIVRHLQRRRHLQEGSPEFGEAFEAYLHHELKTYWDYEGVVELAYWRSTSDFEVDFILNDRTAVEVKAKRHVSDRDLRGLRALQEERLLKHYIVVSQEASL